RYATDGYVRKLVFQNDAGFQLGPVSLDGRWLALTKVNSNADSDVFVANLAAKKPTPKLITKHTGTIENSPDNFTPDSKKLIYLTDGAGEFTQAWTYDLKTGKRVLEAKADWDVDSVGYSENGKYRVVRTNEDASSVLNV